MKCPKCEERFSGLVAKEFQYCPYDGEKLI